MTVELLKIWKWKTPTNGQKDVISSIFTKLWGFISGPLTLLFIPLFLSVEVQGIWFTFISVSALSMLADLGFSAIVLQFSAHESANVDLVEGRLVGDFSSLERISSLFKFIIRWILTAIIVIFPVIAAVGFYLFNAKTDTLFWLIPWLIYLIASAGNLVSQVVSSFIQGLGQVAKVQKLTLWFVVTNTVVSTSLLYFNFGIYALSLSLLTSTLIFAVVLIVNYKDLLSQLWYTKSPKGNWKGEILPLLSRYAVSFISGFLVSQIYTPLVFHFKGAEDAGKVGLSISLISAIYTISFVWFTARIPAINVLVAKRDWMNLDSIFKRTMRCSVVTYVLGICVALFIYLFFSGRYELFDKLIARFLPITPLIVLAICYLFQIFFSGSAVYLRAHKKEVYMKLSLFMALYTAISTLIVINYLNTSYLFVGLLTSFLVFGAAIIRTFKKHQLIWHVSISI